MKSGTKSIIFGYSIINFLFFSCILLSLLSIPYPRPHYVRVLSMPFIIVLFIAIPIGGLILWRLNKKSDQELYSKGQRIYLIVSKVILSVCWIGWILSVFFAVFLSLSIYEPWPVSLRHGPDTQYAIEGFTRQFGFDPPNSISKIYFTVSKGRDAHYYLRFQCTDQDELQKLIEKFKLIESKSNHFYAYKYNTKWWIEGKSKDLKLYSGEFRNLWYDPDSKTVWYEEYTM